MATSASGIVWHNALPTLDMDRRVPMFVVKSMLEPKGWHIGDRINFAPEVPGLEGDVVMVCDGYICLRLASHRVVYVTANRFIEYRIVR